MYSTMNNTAVARHGTPAAPPAASGGRWPGCAATPASCSSPPCSPLAVRVAGAAGRCCDRARRDRWC